MVRGAGRRCADDDGNRCRPQGAKSGRYVAAVAVIRLAADHPLEVEDAFPPPLPWEDEITAGDCFYLHEPIPSWAVSGWQFYRPAELYDKANREALWRDTHLIAEAFARSGGGKAGGPFRDAIPDAIDLIAAVREASPNVSSMHHGDDHWCQVATMGQRLLRTPDRPPDADAASVFAFALLHDSQRHAEGHDPEHGARAAAFARELTGDGLLALGDDRLAVLCDALERHDLGEITDDATTGACWDSDRLTLARLGIKPDPALLSTAAGRSLAPDAARLVFKPADWRFCIYRYHLEAAVPLIADDLAEAA